FNNTKIPTSCAATNFRVVRSLQIEAMRSAAAHTAAETSMTQAARGMYKADPDRPMKAIGNSLEMAKSTQKAAYRLLFNQVKATTSRHAPTKCAGPTPIPQKEQISHVRRD